MLNGRADPIICGTLQYMPPEVHFNNYQNSKLDIWSLGVVLYVYIISYQKGTNALQIAFRV